MHPSIRAINIFVKAVENRSFAVTARVLLIDPTVVSRTIKALEDELGVLLFLRSTRAVKLTDDGALFYRDCTLVLQKLTEATGRFRANQELPHGRLRVGMAPSLPQRLLLRAIPQFQKQYPHIEIVLLRIDGIDDIGRKGIDVLIRTRSQGQRGGTHLEPAGMVMLKLARGRRIVCASPDYLKLAGSPQKPGDLLNHACVAFVSIDRDIQSEWVFSRGTARQKIKVAPKLLAQGTDALREAAVAGCGLVRIPLWTVDDELRNGKLVPVLTDWEDALGMPPMVAVYRKTRTMPPQISIFVRYLVEAFRRYDTAFRPAFKRE